MKRVGEAANAWGTAAGAAGGSAWTEFQVNGRWSRSQTARIDSSGSFTIPLTYGKNKTGRQRFRVGVRINSGTVYAAPLTQYRIRLTASGVRSKYVGETTNAWGKAEGAPGATIVAQFKIAGVWKDSQRVKAKGDGSYTVPLTYGKDKAGTYAWRIAVIHNGTTLYFGEHRLIRTRMAVRIAVIGDSYSAGNGTKSSGNYDGPAGSYRSSLAYGPRFAAMLRATGKYNVQLNNWAWSGATIDRSEHGILTQAATINPATKLVLVTAGGNDAGFGNVLTAFNSGMVYPHLWPLFFAQAKAADDRISQLSRDYQALFKTVAERIGDRPEGRIIFLGYPKVFIPAFLPSVGMVNQLQEKLENSQLEAARQWNASHRLKVSFIPVDGADRRGYQAGVFRGHEADPRPGIANRYRWINESLETAGVFLPSLGKTQAKDSTDMMEWFHPNVTGHYELARLLTKRVQPSSPGIRISSTTAHEEELLSPLLPPDDVLSQDLTLSAWLEGDEVTKRGTAMVFDASGTICGGHKITAYHWDFDSDGNTDLTTQTPPGHIHISPALRRYSYSNRRN